MRDAKQHANAAGSAPRRSAKGTSTPVWRHDERVG